MFKSLTNVAVLIGILLITWGAQAPAAAPAARVRIGVYDSRAIAIAAGRSDVWAGKLQALAKEKEEAQRQNDGVRVAQIKAAGKSLQLLLHLQGFSTAPVDEYLDEHREAMAKIAGDAGVIAITARTQYTDPAVELVDVTDSLVELFKPTEKTRQVIRELKKHEPVKMAEILENPEKF